MKEEIQKIYEEVSSRHDAFLSPSEMAGFWEDFGQTVLARYLVQDKKEAEICSLCCKAKVLMVNKKLICTMCEERVKGAECLLMRGGQVVQEKR